MSDLETAIKAAKIAGEIIHEGFHTALKVKEKQNKSFVTEVDTNSEEKIIQILEEESAYPILSEETRSSLKDQDVYWTADPLDGTTNFIRGINIFCVSIALIKNRQPVTGVIYNPITEELFTGEKNKGGFLNGEKISISDKESVIFVNTGYLPLHKEKYIQVVSKTAIQFFQRKLGSTAYELALLAKGSADGFICWGDELWDHAAGILLVREAGGIVTDWQGNEWSSDNNYVLAGNPKTHSKILQVI